LTAELPNTVTASVHNGPATQADLDAFDGVAPLLPGSTGPLTVEIRVQAVNGGVSVLVFTIKLIAAQKGGELIVPRPQGDVTPPCPIAAPRSTPASISGR
jgi:hypothetical protein